jgi:ankyrin repeat protein
MQTTCKIKLMVTTALLRQTHNILKLPTLFQELTTNDRKLLEAVRQNNLGEARKQIFAGASINSGDCDGNRPLHLAVLSKNTVMLAYLLQQVPNLNAVNKQKQVPLHLAIIGEQHDMVLLLLESGCNVHARDASGHSSICIANEKNLVDIGSLLVDYGANLYGKLIVKFRHNPFFRINCQFSNARCAADKQW